MEPFNPKPAVLGPLRGGRAGTVRLPVEPQQLIHTWLTDHPTGRKRVRGEGSSSRFKPNQRAALGRLRRSQSCGRSRLISSEEGHERESLRIFKGAVGGTDSAGSWRQKSEESADRVPQVVAEVCCSAQLYLHGTFNDSQEDGRV